MKEGIPAANDNINPVPRFEQLENSIDLQRERDILNIAGPLATPADVAEMTSEIRDFDLPHIIESMRTSSEDDWKEKPALYIALLNALNKERNYYTND
ncbi:MAG TPA: hypothetical protein PK609_02735 [Candidatus Paceibacterota bacterium]|nr:hypothetical protein [Candidatus Paceibacterota bacterium]